MTVENKGILSFALDTKIERDAEKGILKISQPVYIAGIVQEFNRENPLKTRDTPSSGTTITEEILPQTEEEKEKVAKLPIRNLIGKLWWLALISRPDIQMPLHQAALWQNKHHIFCGVSWGTSFSTWRGRQTWVSFTPGPRLLFPRKIPFFLRCVTPLLRPSPAHAVGLVGFSVLRGGWFPGIQRCLLVS
jgi:hypothetical protein